MTLHSVIEFIKAHEKELVLFNLDTPTTIAEEITAHIETRNVQVRTAQTASGEPAGVAVLSHDDEVLGLTDVGTLQERLSPREATSRSSDESHSSADTVVSHLKETTFTSYDRGQLLSATREIEDRAHRVGGGTIHAGFQRVSRIADQQSVYTELSSHGVSVHAYGRPDAKPPDLNTGVVHAVENDEIAASWFVVFDGDGDGAQKSALLAEQIQGGSFYGAWTYDPEIVDTACAYLEETYCSSVRDTRPISEL